MTEQLTYASLKSAVDGGVAAFRVNHRLQPAGGPGDKIFPPTYDTGDRTLRYATETRRVDGEDVECVLVDSVASQANRIEDALYRAWEEERLHFPVIRVDFSEHEKLRDLDGISSLTAPHRVFDALLRDSMEGDTLFRDTPMGMALTDASPKAATALYRICPTALVFGGWDSTGPRGGLGNKVQRALASELVAIHAKPGKKTSSRLDPAGIQANVKVYHAASNPDDYTIDRELALLTKNEKPVDFSRKGAEGKEGKKGKPSAVNHSNVAPTVDERAGGVTCDYVRQTTVLSLPALRRLRFPTDEDGQLYEAGQRREAELAARTSLAALGLAGIVLLQADGFDLRSRCALVPEGPMLLEVVSAHGEPPREVGLSPAGAAELLSEAAKAAAELGLGWKREPMRLKPSPKLVGLIEKSRALAAEGIGDRDA
ncbi:MAG: type I-U CRISPR-associated RAMP protein Csb1/Cas7u [Myxococcota bacterium]